MWPALSEMRLYACNELVALLPSRRLRIMFYRQVMGFKIGSQTTVFLHCRFDCAKGLSIGRDTVVNWGCRLDSRGGLRIGDNVVIAAQTCILTADHDPATPDFAGRQRQVVIEDFVFIGTRAMILPGVTVGRGAVVGAGAVVTRDVAPFSVVAGVPARWIGTRNQDLTYTGIYSRLFQ